MDPKLLKNKELIEAALKEALKPKEGDEQGNQSEEIEDKDD